MSKHTILWADDDKDDHEIIRDILKDLKASVEIHEFPNGNEVLQFLQKQTEIDFPCLIVLDMNTPVMDGRTTLAVLRGIRKYDHIPVVVLTTSTSEADKAFCEKHSAEMFSKPSSYERLTRLVELFLKICRHNKSP